ncbi:hypothetical protein [Denitromonas sp.]|uniref:DUF4376 domain-containing protein n=1 Tax=Denitromonas sp. TaxID=2734609 RepID=UPI003A853052
MFQLNGKKISLDQDLTIGAGDDAITYPAGSLKNAELRAELGIVEVPDLVRPDDRRFFVTENEDGSFTATPRPADQVVAPVWDQIKAKRDRLAESGGVQVDGRWYDTDAESRSRYYALEIASRGAPDETVLIPDWRPADVTASGTVALTRGLVVQIIAAGIMQVAAIDAAAQVHKAAMMKIENPFEYDYSAGWPDTFDEAVAQ